MKKADIFEDFFVEEITRRVEESKLSHSEFGRLVFGTDSGPRAWRATREKERKRRISIGEALMMAEVLGLELPALVWEITQKAESKGILT